MLIRHQRHKVNILRRLAFIASVNRLILHCILRLPVVRGVTANPRDAGRCPANTLVCNICQVCTVFIYHGKKKCIVLCMSPRTDIFFPLHPDHRQQHVFRIFLQGCTRSADQVTIQRFIHPPQGRARCRTRRLIKRALCSRSKSRIATSTRDKKDPRTGRHKRQQFFGHMQGMPHTAILPFIEVCFRVIQITHVLHIMQTMVCRNNVVICTGRTARCHRTVTRQLLNTRVRTIIRIRQRQPLAKRHRVGLPGQRNDKVIFRFAGGADNSATITRRLHHHRCGDITFRRNGLHQGIGRDGHRTAKWLPPLLQFLSQSLRKV
ncbi:hypothetical protein ESCOCK430B_26110 [Escherichia coli]